MWTVTALASEARPAKGVIWRVVEDQYRASTRKLVDTLEEHDLLEALLDQDKPPYPVEAEGLHYLLKTPFRYHPPPPFGSRFRRPAAGNGYFTDPKTSAPPWPNSPTGASNSFATRPPRCYPPGRTAHRVLHALRHRAPIDLTRAPLNKDRRRWINPEDYSDTQALADRARGRDRRDPLPVGARHPAGRQRRLAHTHGLRR